MKGAKLSSKVKLAIVSLFAFALPIEGLSFSIDSVKVLPDGQITPDSGVELRIDISTPSLGAFLYSPTEVTVSGNKIDVVVFADDGRLLPAIGSLTEQVALGNFLPGSYDYNVYLIPAYIVGWGTRHVSGTFIVVDICECDLNDDGRCDMRDWLLFGQDWGRTDCHILGTICECDLNDDGRCDMRDWLMFGKNWRRTNCPR